MRIIFALNVNNICVFHYLYLYWLWLMRFRHGKTAVALIVTFLLASWIVSALISLQYNYTHKVAEPLESFGYLYEKPWTRLGPYVMGKFRIDLLLMVRFSVVAGHNPKKNKSKKHWICNSLKKIQSFWELLLLSFKFLGAKFERIVIFL